MNANNTVQYFVDGLSFKPHCIIGFTMALQQHKKSLMPKSNKGIGILSGKAKARMNNAINWMLYLSEGKKYYDKKTKQKYKMHINFITLTLSAKQMHDDVYVVNRMLKPFLKWMKRQGNELYVWRAETQGNGNIHFHITSNRYLNWESIRNKWNSLQQKHGYIKEYISNGGDENPNSTDVDGVKNPNHLAQYMVKYMGKSAEENYCTRYCSIDDKPKIKIELYPLSHNKNKEQITVRRDVTCKVWNCSTELMKKKLTITQLDNGYDMTKNAIESNCESKQFEKMKLFFYPNSKFRNKAMNYIDELLARNELGL